MLFSDFSQKRNEFRFFVVELRGIVACLDNDDVEGQFEIKVMGNDRSNLTLDEVPLYGIPVLFTDRNPNPGFQLFIRTVMNDVMLALGVRRRKNDLAEFAVL